jgi:hypothetical protein
MEKFTLETLQARKLLYRQIQHGPQRRCFSSVKTVAI